MLNSLFIKDYALIDSISVEFGKGLNIITGETGAGKSILIDAMGLLLGERASTEVIRKGAEKSVVEGIFSINGNKKLSQLLKENEIDFSDELIVRREISLKGTNRCFLNDSPVNLNLVKDVGNLLVDLHGQHEHQSLLRTETHIEMLDEFGNFTTLMENYTVKYKSLVNSVSELNDLTKREKEIKEKKEFIEYQIKEIDAVSPEADEDTKIENELKILENSEKLIQLASEAFGVLYEEENSAYDKLTAVQNKLTELSKIDSNFESLCADFTITFGVVQEISNYLRSYKDKVDLEPEHLEELRGRLSSITMLKKKYGGSLNKVIEYRKKINEDFLLAENFSQRIKDLHDKIEKERKECGAVAKQISAKRSEISKQIKKEVELHLKQLGIADPNFSIKICNEKTDDASVYVLVDNSKIKAYKDGIDLIEFHISTNAGEDAKPLTKVASGGEVSRIMLSLKSVLAKNENLPLLIFDEIDTGVSGRVAQKVGQALKDLASYHQIISITHLPQIAGLADSHYSVEKKKTGDRVTSSIKKLTNEERIEEVAKLISGEKVSDAALESAKELISGSLM
ncbi:MAG: DNA repair protein RecN [Flavobacterium sp.]|nr:DNA repair protein RecN [Flavobacterium sp.]